MFRKFYQDTSSTGEKFVKELVKYNKPVSAAQLQGFFMMYKQNNVDTLIKNIPQIWES